ncbi:MAG: energy-coupling factor ABC transporter permease, partial [Methanothrix sp.]
MHIPDGYLGPYTFIAMWIIMIPIWYYAGRKLGSELKSRQVPLLALAAAFSFVIMMFNLPIPGGSTGHAVGAAIIGIVLGPWAGVIAISVALV